MNLGKETEFIEFKESTRQLSRGIEALAAMLNKHGKGKVCFGVKDNGDVCGQTIGNKTITAVSQGIANGIKPAVIPKILIEEFEGKLVLSVEAEGSNKPYSAHGEYLIRSGNENRKLDPEQLRDLMLQNAGELALSMESTDQSLTFTQLKSLYIAHGLTINEETFEKNTGLFTPSAKYNYLAELLSDSNACSIKVVRFRGTDKQEMILRNEYGYKCMLVAMKQAYEYVESLNETRVVLKDRFERKETQLFDAECLKEAWSNACLHTKWIKRVPPAIYIYDDRIEVVSTGGLPADYSTDEFFAGVSHPVNIQLQKIMGQLHFVEQTGHGVPKIVSRYGKEAFEIADNHITVTIPFAYTVSKNGVYDALSLSEPQQRIYHAILENPSATAEDIASSLDLSSARIYQVIKELKTANKIERVGSRKRGYWKSR